MKISLLNIYPVVDRNAPIANNKFLKLRVKDMTGRIFVNMLVFDEKF